MNSKSRSLLALIIATCLLAVPVGAFGKKGKDHFDRGMKAEQNQQWEQAAQEYGSLVVDWVMGGYRHVAG